MTDRDAHNETAREAQARIEIGSTGVSPGVRWFMVSVFLITIFAVPFYQNRIESGDGLLGESARVDRVLPSVEALRSGTAVLELVDGFGEGMDAYERDLERNAGLIQKLLPGTTRTLTKYRVDPNEQMYLGTKGWMFYRPSIEYVSGPGFLEPEVMYARASKESVESDPLAAIVEFRDRLAARGIDLLVVPVPTKAMVYPEEFSDAYESGHGGLQNRSFGKFMDSLVRNGVHAVDLLPELIEAKSNGGEALYLATDTHWSPEGMGVATDEITDYVRTNELLTIDDSIEFRVKEQMEFRGSGDLERMLGQRGDEYFFLVLRMEQRTLTARKATPRKLFYPSGVTWSVDGSAEVLVLGDSFSRVFSEPSLGWGQGMGLFEQLSFELETPVDGISINDQGAYATRQALSQDVLSGNDRLEGKKLVIWEFAMRELSFGDWRTGYEYEPRSLYTENTGISGGRTVRATGIIQEITRPLDPEKTPYPNGLVSIHLTEVASTDSSISLPEEVVVFAWGMRDHKHTAAAKYPRGQELSLDLRLWFEARDTLGDFSRRDFDDLSLLRLTPFFGESIVEGQQHDIETADSMPETATRISGENVDALLADRIRRSTNEVELNFLEELQGYAAIDEYPGPEDIEGRDDGWYMTRKSLDTLLSGSYWASSEEKWHSRLIEPGALDAIVSYSEALRSRDIDLLLVPVPTKIYFYSDRLLDTDAYAGLDETVRLDRKFFEFYGLLRERGVEVMDVYPDLVRLVRESDEFLYREDDHHWSSYGDREIAKLIGDQVEGYDGLDAIPRRNYTVLEQTVIVEGVDRGV
ncbi:MAG: hypothetical protein VCB26_12145, partial [Candidatus Hydrogenedentota bacterium]